MEITYKGITYEMDKSFFGETSLNDSTSFQYLQLKHCLETKDFVTLENRITNMLLHGGLVKK